MYPKAVTVTVLVPSGTPTEYLPLLSVLVSSPQLVTIFAHFIGSSSVFVTVPETTCSADVVNINSAGYTDRFVVNVYVPPLKSKYSILPAEDAGNVLELSITFPFLLNVNIGL